MKRTTPRRRNRRFRGQTTHGWGSKKKHRGAGSRGGRGMAGSGKRADQKKPTVINLYGTSYFGKHGFVPPSSVPRKTITLRDVVHFAKKQGPSQELNLTTLGYDKLLGTGSITIPLRILIGSASRKAIEKVKRAGGDVVLPPGM